MVDDLATVQFHGDTIFTVRHGGDVCVAPKPISDRLGLAWGSQYNRIKRDQVLSEGFFIVKIPSLGGEQETGALRLDLLPGWLFGISVKQVRADRRETVVTYKKECHATLYAHFFGQPAAAHRESAASFAMPPTSRPFDEWTPAELNSKVAAVNAYRTSCGPPAGQWALQRFGFPMPPDSVMRGRQYELDLSPNP